MKLTEQYLEWLGKRLNEPFDDVVQAAIPALKEAAALMLLTGRPHYVSCSHTRHVYYVRATPDTGMVNICFIQPASMARFE